MPQYISCETKTLKELRHKGKEKLNSLLNKERYDEAKFCFKNTENLKLDIT